jgi:hypothetical protein
MGEAWGKGARQILALLDEDIRRWELGYKDPESGTILLLLATLHEIDGEVSAEGRTLLTVNGDERKHYRGVKFEISPSMPYGEFMTFNDDDDEMN